MGLFGCRTYRSQAGSRSQHCLSTCLLYYCDRQQNKSTRNVGVYSGQGGGLAGIPNKDPNNIESRAIAIPVLGLRRILDVYMHTYIRRYMHAYTPMCIHMCIHAYIYTITYTYIYIYIYMPTYIPLISHTYRCKMSVCFFTYDSPVSANECQGPRSAATDLAKAWHVRTHQRERLDRESECLHSKII